ncbi:MAG: HlyD family secretion protein [Verrucomicrobiales bacterium]|jgi:HlyD family secretion protein
MKPDGVIKTLLQLCTAAAIIAAPTTSTFAQDAAKKPAAKQVAKKAPTPPKPITEVKKEDFRVVVTLPAVFEGTKLTPVTIEPKEWIDLTVKSAVPHGTRVQKGTRLVELDLKTLEDQVIALETASQSSRLTLQATIDGLENLEQTNPMDLTAANQAKRQADEALDRWLKLGRDREVETYKRSLESSKRSLEYAQEELNQLKQMYDEDDLTEETEEIILKRAERGAEQATYYLKRAQQSYDYAMKSTLPRQHQQTLDAHKRATLNHDLAVRAIPRVLALKRLEVAKAKEDTKKAAKKLADLKRDLAVLKDITSPSDGIVYYGQSVLGNWTSAAEAKKLVTGGKITPKSIFMTIVHDGLRVSTSIPEDKLAILKAGAKGYVIPVSNPLMRLPTQLGKINYSTSPLGFKTSCNIEAPENANLFPGMKASVSFTIADRKGVITVPVSSISRDGNKTFVHLAKEGADPERHEVKLAETDGKKIVVLKGLNEKDKVLTVAP